MIFDAVHRSADSAHTGPKFEYTFKTLQITMTKDSSKTLAGVLGKYRYFFLQKLRFQKIEYPLFCQESGLFLKKIFVVETF